MKAQNILVAVAGLLVTGVQASPCKPSSIITTTSGEIAATTTAAVSTTTTDETTTELETSSVEFISSTETTAAAAATTATDATTIELETSSAELTSSTETTTAAATTTASPGITYQCPGGFPSGPKCGVKEDQSGSGVTYLGIQIGSFTLDECVQFCIDTPNCDYFAWQDLPNDAFCEFWSGTFASQGRVQSWAWYEMDCFCNLPEEESAATTTVTPP
ncbi:hypothetical protein IL306_008706 [Fusarium sp. DS 682]|nr:hypothetical protein IL306_008706 [Fusarium sp. DS 682]